VHVWALESRIGFGDGGFVIDFSSSEVDLEKVGIELCSVRVWAQPKVALINMEVR
jgi:hypothetical protein